MSLSRILRFDSNKPCYQYLLQHLILKNELKSEVLNIFYIVMNVSHCL